ncbi:hypothetical protein ACFWPV_04925 [Streptomyces uncialis]|uniref:hypothetical protein n=1 Tax=Streptomyces uncialis TaxID=1048205 RepID=UPI00365102F3
MRPVPQPAPKALTGLDHRVEAAVGHSIDTLWDQRDGGLLDEPRARLVDAHRALVSAETSVTFYRVLLHRLASGEFPVDEALVHRIGRTVAQLQEAATARDEQHRSVLAVLEPVEETARAQAPAGAVDLPARDIAALLAISQGAKLHEHLLTQRLSVVTASGTRVGYEQLQQLERTGLVVRDTGHPVHAGQPVTLTDAGRSALAGTRRPPAAVTGAVPRTGTWPSAARSRN